MFSYIVSDQAVAFILSTAAVQDYSLGGTFPLMYDLLKTLQNSSKTIQSLQIKALEQCAKDFRIDIV